MKKWLTGGAVFLAVAALFWTFSVHLKTKVEERNAVIEARMRLEEEAKKASAARIETASAKLGKLTRLEELEEFAAKTVAGLSKGEREAILPVLRAKLFEANFRRAKLYLERAGDLLRADNNHPTGKEYLGQAEGIYKKMEKLMEQGIPERTGDTEWNSRLNYLKGFYFFRLAELTFLRAKDPKTEAARVEELAKLSANHLSAVYPYIVRSGKDEDQFWRTDVALEILQKKAQSMGAGAEGDSDKFKLELLPSRSGQKQGPTFSIEGLEEGRR